MGLINNKNIKINNEWIQSCYLITKSYSANQIKIVMYRVVIFAMINNISEGGVVKGPERFPMETDILWREFVMKTVNSKTFGHTDVELWRVE